MTLGEAVKVFDRVVFPPLPPQLDAVIIEGEQAGIPYCCNLPVVQNSQDGTTRIYCNVCGRTISEIGRQWWISSWGTQGIKLPKADPPGPHDKWHAAAYIAIHALPFQNPKIEAEYEKLKFVVFHNPDKRSAIYRQAAGFLNPVQATGDGELFERLQQAMAILEAK